jgi:hypothetical protein
MLGDVWFPNETGGNTLEQIDLAITKRPLELKSLDFMHKPTP